IGHHQPGHATQDFRCSHRQVELAHADIDPHVTGAGIEEWIARQSESADIVVGRNVLIADADVDMTEIDDVAEILRSTLVPFVVLSAFLYWRAALFLFRSKLGLCL